MGRGIAAIVLGLVVGIVTVVPAWFFLMAATWQSIHGGMSEIVLAVLSPLAMAASVSVDMNRVRRVQDDRRLHDSKISA